MLQQTRANVVAAYFERFMKSFPTLRSLAEASQEEVYAEWQGLGYYSRARRLHQGAKHVLDVHGGAVPESVEELLKIPGIGRYTAGAIASQAFGKRAAIVDGNVQRILTRLYALGGDPTKKEIAERLWREAGAFVEEGEPGVVNQALMELGALVCTPKKPACTTCPWSSKCAAFSANEVERYPELKKRAAPTSASIIVCLFRHRDAYLVETAADGARWWAGLSLFPMVELGDATEGAVAASSRLLSPAKAKSIVMPSDQEERTRLLLKLASKWSAPLAPLQLKEARALAEIRHQVTRYRLTLAPVLVSLSGTRGAPLEGGRWVKASELSSLSWPGPLGRLVQSLTQQ